MDNYKKKLKKRLTMLTVFSSLEITFIVLIGVYFNITSNNNINISDVVTGIQIGMFIGLQIIMITQIAKYTKALKTENDLKLLYIEENDERIKLIEDKIGGVGINVILCGLTTATIISGFFSQIVFTTLIGVLIFSVITKVMLKIYYKSQL